MSDDDTKGRNAPLAEVLDAEQQQGRNAPLVEVDEADDKEFFDAVRKVVRTDAKTTKREAAALKFVERAFIEQGGVESDLAFQARSLVQNTLPHRKPKNDELYIRKNGNASLIVQSGTDADGKKIGIPYGSVARLLFAFITREAVKTHSRAVTLGDTLAEFCRVVGINPNNGGSAKMVQEQLRRLLSCSIAFVSTTQLSDGQGFEERLNLPVATYAKLWFRFKRGTHDNPSLFGPSVILLNVDFYDAIVKSPVPLDMSVLKLLKKSPMAIDVYSWAKYRSWTAKKQTRLSWFQLAGQFGSEYKTTKDFRRNFISALKKVLIACPELKLKVVPGGLLITPTREKSRLEIEPTIIEPRQRVLSARGSTKTSPVEDVEVEPVVEEAPPADETVSDKWKRLLGKKVTRRTSGEESH